MNRTRVLFFSQAPGVGGGERAVLPLLARIEDIDLLVAAPAPVASYAEELGVVKASVLELPRAHRLVHGGRIAVGSRAVRKLARETGTDVLYANGTRAIPYAVAAAMRGVRPLLFHHHGVLERGPIRTLVRGAGRWADAIIVPSQTAAAPFGHASQKVRVVANGVDLDHFRPRHNTTDARATFGVGAGSAVIGTLTRADPSKGMEQFVAVARSVAGSLPDAHFVLAGGVVFPHELKPYERVVERARLLGPRMTVTGRIENPADFYNAVDVFVHLGRPEGFGLTVLEALASGVPVVAYHWGAIPEVFDGMVTLVPPGDIPAAAAAVVRLASNATARDEVGARGRRWVEDRFGVDQTATQLRDVITTLAGRAPQ